MSKSTFVIDFEGIRGLLSRYIYGIKKPSAQRTEQILGAIRKLGCEMAAIAQ